MVVIQGGAKGSLTQASLAPIRCSGSNLVYRYHCKCAGNKYIVRGFCVASSIFSLGSDQSGLVSCLSILVPAFLPLQLPPSPVFGVLRRLSIIVTDASFLVLTSFSLQSVGAIALYHPPLRECAPPLSISLDLNNLVMRPLISALISLFLLSNSRSHCSSTSGISAHPPSAPTPRIHPFVSLLSKRPSSTRLWPPTPLYLAVVSVVTTLRACCIILPPLPSASYVPSSQHCHGLHLLWFQRPVSLP